MAKFANFEVHVEIEKLKIHVKGDREIAPEVANNVAQQISGIFQPSGLLEAPKDGQNGHRVIEASAPAAPARRGRRKNSGPAANGGAKTLNWNHDATKWGTPVQTWTQVQKINWLLHVVEQEGVSKDLSPVEMSDVWESKFRTAGLLTRTNIGRDLKNNPDNFGAVDGRWFLKQGGKTAAAALVNEAKGAGAQ
ncbi:MAG TPA: hypothetical protein VE377_09090 [Candidatus Dormibacteraeota bacterium]|nr:hypothetical protein [Candidatus Dormibacteraeota bacterium]